MNSKFSEFYALLAKMPGGTKEEIVRQYSGGTSLRELYERAPRVYARMIQDMKKITANEGDAAKMDKLRKRAIAAVAGYFDKSVIYTDLSRRDRMQKVIATVCRAAGVNDFNSATEAQLKRVYSEFVRRQKTAEAAEKACNEAKNNKSTVIRKGCMSLTINK